MSLADHIRLLRAWQGGASYDVLKERLDVATIKQLFQIERKQHDVVEDATLEKLALAFEVPVDDLRQYQQRTRKALANFCQEAQAKAEPISLRLRHGEVLTGHVQWVDMAAIGLQCEDAYPAGAYPTANTVVVQRHAVVDWH